MPNGVSETRDDLPRHEVRGTLFVWSRTMQAWVCQTCGSYVGDYQKHGGCKHGEVTG